MTFDEAEEEEAKTLMEKKIARVLDETKSSNATHIRKLKELSSIRSSSSSPIQFFDAFVKSLTPLFDFQRRVASAERIVRFVSLFAATVGTVSGSDWFLERFVRFLLGLANANHKTARFRSCQIISEIIMRLPDDAEVSDELWDEVIECMKVRMGDKIYLVRTFAVRALSRFATDSSDILESFLDALALEQNADVRKTIVLSLPPSNATSAVIVDCTLDVSEAVRKAAYCVLAEKFPLQSLSIKLRAIILQRGLADRSDAVTRECLKLLKDGWLTKYCNGDPVQLLKYLDVETYELVGESVMDALLKAGLVSVKDDESIQQFILSTDDLTEGDAGHNNPNIQLMEAEVAIYWRTMCRHLQTEAQAKGSCAAATMGTEATVYAADASDTNDLLEKVLPATVSDYVELVKAHLAAGPNYHFASRQLLLLGAMLDFSDSTNRKTTRAFVEELLRIPLKHDDQENKVIIGDGINIGGDRDWANAVSGLARKVHAAAGEFEEVVLGVVEELARPCRERAADFMQWMHCLAVTGLLLENAKSFRLLEGKAIEPTELLHSLLLPGAKHVHLDVQRVAVWCLGLFGLLERKPSEELVKQLRFSFVKGPPSIRVVACKALLDIGMWHGPQEVDKAMGSDLSSQFREDNVSNTPINFHDTDEDFSVELLDLLFAGFDMNGLFKSSEVDEDESILATLGEGFAKILLLSENYPTIPVLALPLFLTKLISLYFSDQIKDLKRLKQCLSVFFEHYPCLSVNHKNYLSEAFIPVMCSLWPGINGNPGGASQIVANMRKRAVQASLYMLQMMQAPLYSKEAETTEDTNDSLQPSLECGEEGLAIRIAIEMVRFPTKKSAAEKTYIVTLCKILVLLQFRLSEQGAIKLMRRLLHNVAESIRPEKELVRELQRMAERLKAVDREPDEELVQDEAAAILGRLKLSFNFDKEVGSIPMEVAPQSVRSNRARRQVRRQEESSSSDEEVPPTPVVPNEIGTMSMRSQRASKTAALTKMMSTAKKPVRIDEDDDDNDEDISASEVTSEEDSDESVTIE